MAKKTTKAPTAAQQQAARDFAAEVGITLKAIRCHFADGTALVHDDKPVVGWKGLAAAMIADGDLDAKGELTRKGKSRRTRLKNAALASKVEAAKVATKPKTKTAPAKKAAKRVEKVAPAKPVAAPAKQSTNDAVKARLDLIFELRNAGRDWTSIAETLAELGPRASGKAWTAKAASKWFAAARWNWRQLNEGKDPWAGDDDPKPPKPRGGKRRPKTERVAAAVAAKVARDVAAPSVDPMNTTAQVVAEAALDRLDRGSLVDMLRTLLQGERRPQQRVGTQRRRREDEAGEG